MKYIHIYDNNSYCESDSFKYTPNTIVLTDEQYEQLGKTLKFENEKLVAMTEDEKTKANQVIYDVDRVLTESEVAIAEKKKRISELKVLLKETDYKAIKYAEGFISEADYLPIKQVRQSYRNKINELEAQIGG